MNTANRQLLPRNERRLSILDGAAEAFAAAGYAATCMEDVAAATGVSKLIVYRHFESKADLYRHVLQRTLDRLAEGLQAEAADNPVGASVRAVLRLGRQSPAALRLLLVHAAREPAFVDYARELRSQVVDAWAVYMPLPDGLMRRWATQTAVGYVWDAVLGWLDLGEPKRDEEFIRRCTGGLHALLRGLVQPETVKPGPWPLPPRAH